MSDKLKNVVVIGLGLVGASFAGAVKEYDLVECVIGVDVEKSSIDLAREKGWVDKGFAADEKKLADVIRNEAQLVVIATPVGVIPDYFKLLAEWDYTGVVTDTGSTKAHIAEAAQSILAYPENYIPGHPMAGSEKSGIEGAYPELFQGAHWILCPDQDTSAENYQMLFDLFTGVGARVVSLSRYDHDQAVAIVSHVPHIVASSLVELASNHADDQQSLFKLAAGGFKDSTRIAAGSAQLWSGISFDNAAALKRGLAEIRGIIGEFENALEDGNRQKFTDLLHDAAEIRKGIPAAWVPSTDKLLEVRIPMQDRTGVIAEVTTIAGNVGCNIQSIEIDHITDESAVLSLILTDEGDVGKLSLQLIEAGFPVSFNPLSAKEYTHVE